MTARLTRLRFTPWTSLLACLFLFTNALSAASLTLTKLGASEFLVEAAAPIHTPYVLQESENLHLWGDVGELVSGRLSHRFDGAGTPRRYFRLIPEPTPPPPIRVVILGDSTVAGERGWGSGWGTGLFDYFKPSAQIVNLAWPNMNTRDLFASEPMAKMLAIKPNFVLVEFGWIDSGGFTTLAEFGANLRSLVETIRGFNGTPILITQPDPRSFDANGKVIRILEDRAHVMKQVAAELKTHLIDLHQMSYDLVSRLGKDGIGFLAFSTSDLVHYSLEGGRVIAGMVVRSLPDNLGPYLTGIFNSLPSP